MHRNLLLLAFLSMCLTAPTQIALAEPRTSTCKIVGQVPTINSRQFSGAQLTLLDTDSGRELERLDSVHGSFVFERVPPGSYKLRVRRGSQVRVQQVACTAAGETVKTAIVF